MSFFRKVMVKPWEHAGEMKGLHGEYTNANPVGRTGLLVFLAVISSMFLLFFTTYYTRSQFPDWEVLKDPDILWINTAMLVLASITLQLASFFAGRGVWVNVRYALIASAGLTLLFVAGQWDAWQQLVTSGMYASVNPANAFFYLLTGLHVLHLIGGLCFMVIVGFRLKRQEDKDNIRQSLASCTTYWHYLLLVWLVLFTLLLKT